MRISVIVPIRGESARAADNLGPLLDEGPAELLVADAGDDPGASAAYRARGARLVTGAGSRGSRLAAAARESSGETLFFLHADSRPPGGALESIRRAIAGGAAAGCFSLAYDGGGAALVAVAGWANLRSRWLRLPFGDQGLFCRRDAYERAGGFRDMPLCDDLDLVRRLARTGRFVVLPDRTVTSARRFLAHGIVRQSLRDLRVQAGYFLGVSPERLARWYRGG